MLICWVAATDTRSARLLKCGRSTAEGFSTRTTGWSKPTPTTDKISKDQKKWHIAANVPGLFPKPDEFETVAALIRSYEGIEGTIERARAEVARCEKLLEMFPDGREKRSLTDLARYVVARDR